jgi:hypothetical protein
LFDVCLNNHHGSLRSRIKGVGPLHYSCAGIMLLG